MAVAFYAVTVMSLQNSLLTNAIPLIHHPSGIVAGLNGSSNLRRCRRVAMQRKLVSLVLGPNIPKTERAMKKVERRGPMRSSEMEYLKLSRLENDDLDQKTNIKRTDLTGTLANLTIFEIVIAR
jgi:hypothetical protein